jgi:hypothetical protein
MDVPIVVKDADENDLDSHHKLFSAGGQIPRGDNRVPSKDIKRKVNKHGNLIGTANANPLLDTSMYELILDEGDVEYYSANRILLRIYLNKLMTMATFIVSLMKLLTIRKPTTP